MVASCPSATDCYSLHPHCLQLYSTALSITIQGAGAVRSEGHNATRIISRGLVPSALVKVEIYYRFFRRLVTEFITDAFQEGVRGFGIILGALATELLLKRYHWSRSSLHLRKYFKAHIVKYLFWYRM